MCTNIKMALINCPECGKQISDLAVSCPNCAYPINPQGGVQEKKVDTKEIEKFLELALKGIQGQNSNLVERYCQNVLEIDPKNARAWELQARGILFDSSLQTNKVPQAISAAASAVLFTEEDKQEELAASLFDSIALHVNGLLQNAISMPIIYSPQYIGQVMSYFSDMLTGIPKLSKDKIRTFLSEIKEADEKSRKSFLPKRRALYAARAGKPAWDVQFRKTLQDLGIL